MADRFPEPDLDPRWADEDERPMWHEWNEGGVAYRAGQPLTSCPYPMQSPQGRRWREGWVEHSADAIAAETSDA